VQICVDSVRSLPILKRSVEYGRKQ
jgi:hypothetical protein